jgi:hypothetical protein
MAVYARRPAHRRNLDRHRGWDRVAHDCTRAPALVGTQVGDMPIYLINLTFLASVLVTYIALNRRREGQELGFGRVMFFGSGYGAYLVAMGFVLTR